MSSGEVGNLYGDAAILCRLLTEFCDAGPFGGIVYINVKWKAMAQAMNQAIVHRVVHDVRYAQLMAFCLYLCNMWLGILGNDSLCGITLDGFATVKHDTAARVFLCEASCATNRLHAAVGTRRSDIVLQEDALAVDRADEGIVDTYILGHIGGWSQRDEVVETVATMYV